MVVSTVCVYWCCIGDMSWVMRIQNHSHYQTSPLDFPLTDITTLFMPSLASRKEQQFGNFVSGHARINSENLAESEYDVCISLGISLTVSKLFIMSIITRCGRKVMRLTMLCTNRQSCCLPLHVAVRLTHAIDSV